MAYLQSPNTWDCRRVPAVPGMTKGAHHDGDRYRLRRFDPGDLRPLYGAAGVRALCQLVAERAARTATAANPRNRRRNGRRHRGAASRPARRRDRRHRPQCADARTGGTSISAPNVRFQAADAQALPFDENSFDLVVCQFGVMFFPDKVRANSEARRVLRNGGRYMLVIWDRIEHNLATMAAGRAGRRTCSRRCRALL